MVILIPHGGLALQASKRRTLGYFEGSESGGGAQEAALAVI